MPSSENETDSDNDVEDEKPFYGANQNVAFSADQSSSQPSKSMHIQRMFIGDSTTPQDMQDLQESVKQQQELKQKSEEATSPFAIDFYPEQ